MIVVFGAVLGLLYGGVAVLAVSVTGKRRVYWVLVGLALGFTLLGVVFCR